MAVHVVYIIEKTRRTPSGCNDDILEVGDFMKKRFFDLSESFFSAFGENFAYCFVVSGFDIKVEIDKVDSLFLGEGFAESSFYRSQHDLFFVFLN